jgi:hypothetical protein
METKYRMPWWNMVESFGVSIEAVRMIPVVSLDLRHDGPGPSSE